MIDTALILLKDELSNYLSSRDTATVVVDNIGLFETPDGVGLTDNIIITLVNVEEDSTLKNQSALRRNYIRSVLSRSTICGARLAEDKCPS